MSGLPRIGFSMQDIGLHPDSGKREPPDLAPIKVYLKATIEIGLDLYAPEEKIADVISALEQEFWKPYDDGYEFDVEHETFHYDVKVEQQ